MTVEEVVDEDHEPTCDLFDRLNALKNDEELMDLATDFVFQLLRTAQEEALKRGHVPSKVNFFFFFSFLFFLLSLFLSDGTKEQNESRVAT